MATTSNNAIKFHISNIQHTQAFTCSNGYFTNVSQVCAVLPLV